MEFESIKFDYYNSRFSYMRYIMEQLNKSSIEQAILGEIFNTFVSRYDSNEVNEIVIYSSMFENKINKLDENKRYELLNNLYNCYIKNMIINFSNGDMDAVILFFNNLQDKIKSFSGYYGICGEKGYFNSLDNKAFIR